MVPGGGVGMMFDGGLAVGLTLALRTGVVIGTVTDATAVIRASTLTGAVTDGMIGTDAGAGVETGVEIWVCVIELSAIAFPYATGSGGDRNNASSAIVVPRTD